MSVSPGVKNSDKHNLHQVSHQNIVSLQNGDFMLVYYILGRLFVILDQSKEGPFGGPLVLLCLYLNLKKQCDDVGAGWAAIKVDLLG